MRPEIVVDLAAVRHNVRTLADLVAPAAMMTVVKADGYGHGIVESGRAARAGGAEWLGVATVPEALALRDAGDTGRLLCWLTLPADVEDGSLARAVEADVDVTAYTVERLDQIVAAGSATRPARPAQGRHRALPRWRGPRRLAGPGRPRGRARARGPRPDHRRLVPLRLQRRARPPGQRPPGAALPRGAPASPRRPACDPRSATSPTPPPRSCARAAGSTWCASASRPTASTPRPTPTTTPTCARR